MAQHAVKRGVFSSCSDRVPRDEDPQHRPRLLNYGQYFPTKETPIVKQGPTLVPEETRSIGTALVASRSSVFDRDSRFKIPKKNVLSLLNPDLLKTNEHSSVPQ